MNHPHPVIELIKVSKSFGDTVVLKDIGLSIMPGEFVILFGPSGSGKSSLLNIMAGLEAPDKGTFKSRGHDISHFNSAKMARFHRIKMGMVFQNFNLIKSLPVWENVALPLVADGVGYATRKRKAMHLLKSLGMLKYANRAPGELSGGQQQRVAIARALANNPFLLLIDEPTGNLDSSSAAEVMKIFTELHQKDKHTLVLVTHNPDHLPLASRVVYLQDGSIIKEDTNPGGTHALPR